MILISPAELPQGQQEQVGGIGDVPQVFEPLPLWSLLAVVVQGEPYPQQGAEAVDEEHAQAKALGEMQIEQFPPAEGVQKQPEQGPPAHRPAVGEVKDQNEQNIPPIALKDGKVPGEDYGQGRQNIAQPGPLFIALVHGPQCEQPYELGEDDIPVPFKQ